MKHFFLLFFTVIAISCYAQPTITSAVAGSVGDAFSFTSVTTEDFDPGATGADATWDFSGISTSGTAYDYTFIDPATTGVAGDFPGANTATSDGSGNYAFFKITSSEFTNYGVYSPTATLSYSDPEEIFVFPLTYNTENSDDLYCEFTSGVDIVRSGSNELVGDGYGTLKLPSATFTNVLRVKLEETYSDVPSGVPVTIDYHFQTYYWLKEGIIGPIFSYSEQEVTTLGSTTVTEMYQINNDAEPGTGILENAELPVQIFPNPSTDHFTVNAKGLEQIQVFNTLGEVIFTQAGIANDTYTVDANNFIAGVYLIQIQTDEGITTSKIQIQ